MILTQLDNVTAYRMHVPKWAVTPTSGAGAAKHGGRANRPDIEALYLSLDTNTAILEYKQVSALLRPGTLTSYQLTAAPIVDFTRGYSAFSWDSIWEDFYCDWRELWFNQRIEPASWGIGDAVIAHGAKGIIFKSCYPGGGTNLVLFRRHLEIWIPFLSMIRTGHCGKTHFEALADMSHSYYRVILC